MTFDILSLFRYWNTNVLFDLTSFIVFFNSANICSINSLCFWLFWSCSPIKIASVMSRFFVASFEAAFEKYQRHRLRLWMFTWSKVFLMTMSKDVLSKDILAPGVWDLKSHVTRRWTKLKRVERSYFTSTSLVITIRITNWNFPNWRRNFVGNIFILLVKLIRIGLML